MKSYREELLELHHQRIYPILLAGALFMACCATLDFLISPQTFADLMIYRVAGIALCLLFFLLNDRNRQKTSPFLIGFASYLALCLVILITVVQMGGVASPYYMALLVVMTIYGALTPLTASQTVVSGLLPTLVYGTILTMISENNSAVRIELFAQLFFLTSMVFIIATQSWADNKARNREYQLRKEENQVAEKLHKEAKLLEREVEKRSREYVQIEARYQLLFNQIADDVALVSPGGAILECNRNFREHFDVGTGEQAGSIFAIAPPEERTGLKELLERIFFTGQPIRNRQLMLMKKDSSLAEMELSASLLHNGPQAVGALLLVRDISQRRQIERQLLASLELRKETETAAILALAKLSEFRDTPASNHLERIREYCRTLAVELSGYPELRRVMTPSYIEDIYHASILHDIGKVAIPELYPLQAPASEEQLLKINRQHTLTGGNVIREMQQESQTSSFLEMAKHIAYFHHERWDGKGVPHGLMKREIPLAARIMAVADLYEEITMADLHRDLDSAHKEAERSIASRSGTYYDPLVVGAFLTRGEEFKEILQRLR